MTARLILGSESVFRAKLLEEAGYEFEVIKPKIDEKAIRDNDPSQLVLRLGVAKSEKIGELLGKGEKAIIVTSDHVLVRASDGVVLEKPINEFGEACPNLVRSDLKSFKDETIISYTSLVVYNLQNSHRSLHVDLVNFMLKDFSEEDINVMIKDPLTYQAAGALPLGIVGSRACELVKSKIHHVMGDQTGIMGLPMSKLSANLAAYSYQRKAAV